MQEEGKRRDKRWKVVRLEFALYHPRNQAWHLYPKFHVRDASSLANDEVTYRMQIQQMLSVTDALLHKAIPHSSELSEFLFADKHTCDDHVSSQESKEATDFVLCPCEIATQTLRGLVDQNVWEQVIQSYLTFVETGGLGTTSQIRDFLTALRKEPDDFRGCTTAIRNRAHEKNPTETSEASDRGKPAQADCDSKLSLDAALDLLSALPIQCDWDLFGVWSEVLLNKRKSRSCLNPFLARLRFWSPESPGWNEAKRRFKQSYALLRYPVSVQFLSGKELDFIAKCPVKRQRRDTEAAYRAYALFMDELQKKLQGKSDTYCTYLIAYPILAYDNVHFLQFRIEGAKLNDPDPLKSLAKAWQKIHLKLQYEELLAYLTKAVEQISTSVMQHHILKELCGGSEASRQTESGARSNGNPVFERNNLAAALCSHINEILPAKHVYLPSIGAKWEYGNNALAEEWILSDGPTRVNPSPNIIQASQHPIYVDLSDDRASDASRAYYTFLLNQHWRWIDVASVHLAALAAGEGCQGQLMSRKMLAERALSRVIVDEKTRQSLEKKLKALRDETNTARQLQCMDVLYENLIPAIEPWRSREPRWSLADMYGLPPKVLAQKARPNAGNIVPLDYIESMYERLEVSFRSLLSDAHNKQLGVINHFDQLVTSQSPEEIRKVLALLKELDWESPPRDREQTISTTQWFVKATEFLGAAEFDANRWNNVVGDIWKEFTAKLAPLRELKNGREDWPPEFIGRAGTDLKTEVCKFSGVLPLDIIRIHAVAEHNLRHCGPNSQIAWFGWSGNGNKQRLSATIELAWKFSGLDAGHQRAIFDPKMRGKMAAAVSNPKKFGIDLGLEEIFRIICLRYRGHFHLLNGEDHYDMWYDGEPRLAHSRRERSTNAYYYCVIGEA